MKDEPFKSYQHSRTRLEGYKYPTYQHYYQSKDLKPK
jgi:predicted NAD-dependent protein-ADP-ribosyltransferase YbiA (DUF1768 family)